MLKLLTALLLLTTSSFILMSCGTYKSKYAYRWGDDGLIYNSHNDQLFTGTILDTADVIIEFQVVDGKKNGSFRTYYLDGQIEKTGYVIDNENMGTWKYYYPNGQIESKGDFESNKPDGNWISYYPDGTRESEGKYRNGKQDGIWTYYDENGEIINQIIYENGDFVGLQKRFV